MDSILNFYLDYIDDENLGRIANSHLAFADQSKKMVIYVIKFIYKMIRYKIKYIYEKIF